VVEKKGPIEALKESASMFKKTWGEQVGGSMGFGLLFFLLNLPPIFLIVIATTTGHGPTILVSVFFFGLYLIILSLIQSTLKAIFQAALYLYARNGEAPRGFDSELLAGAIPQKKKGFVKTHIID